MNPEQQPNEANQQPADVPQQPVGVPQAPNQPQAVRYIAVDANGVPLPNQPGENLRQPQTVYMSRPMDPAQPQISDDVRQRHEESKKKYSFLNLSEGEYVVSYVTRHPIGIISIWTFVTVIILILLGVLVAFGVFGASTAASFGLNSGNMPSSSVLSIPIVLLILMFLIGGYIAAIVYNGNKFFLTNESVIQEVQTSLFTKREQTVSLGNIEDASYSQHGIVQAALGYGSIRLSTQGDETTYRFNFVSQPKKQIAMLNDAVEAFKNGRPIAQG